MSHDTHTTPDGLTPATAIPVDGVSAEWKWMCQHYPTALFLHQMLERHPEGPRDVLVVRVGDQVIRVYFDISAFFGLRKNRPTAPCPYCGQPLRTARAKQCRHCKREWREAE